MSLKDAAQRAAAEQDRHARDRAQQAHENAIAATIAAAAKHYPVPLRFAARMQVTEPHWTRGVLDGPSRLVGRATTKDVFWLDDIEVIYRPTSDAHTLHLLRRCTACGSAFQAEPIRAPRGEYVAHADRKTTDVDEGGYRVPSDEAARERLVANVGEALRKSPAACLACASADPCPTCGRGWTTTDTTPAAAPPRFEEGARR